ncbi:flagellar hook-basal body protein [Acetobacterium woodii]|uniref:Flagellar hook-basal body rod protein FlgF n=1 Tax=Acetobacterium woodii (strain ATCC 29683 / DSM 1030 / JCM 2381 / KCTC 1655 / WB1) TaxID=931626 RepID=H6LE28_ACEWD|nr:flagellar hook basal-body protein [Acetobacterium woodii]AFA49261.1 flagellar hook-basal body rod protein FlgF [Acetobacterium woodii DSM 1030]
MDRGSYSAAAGMLSGQKAISVLAQNVANVRTAGYKSQSTIQSTFGDYMISRMSMDPQIAQTDIGPGAYITVNAAQYIDFMQGSFTETHRSVDLAIQGQGFFVIQSPADGQVLTRNGQFEVDEQGFLILPGVGQVLNTANQPIRLAGSDFKVEPNGVIRQNDVAVDRINISTVANPADLTPIGEGYFQSAIGFQAAPEGTYSLFQGRLEESNVDMTGQMSDMISKQNNFTSCTQMLKIFDRISEIASNTIGKVG